MSFEQDLARGRGLEALADSTSLLYPAVARLLARNSDKADVELLTNQLSALLVRGDENDISVFGSHFRDYATANPEAPLTPLLLTLYENVPGSFTRYSTVKLLLARHAAPDWLLEECRWDCYEETRAS